MPDAPRPDARDSRPPTVRRLRHTRRARPAAGLACTACGSPRLARGLRRTVPGRNGHPRTETLVRCLAPACGTAWWSGARLARVEPGALARDAQGRPAGRASLDTRDGRRSA